MSWGDGLLKQGAGRQRYLAPGIGAETVPSISWRDGLLERLEREQVERGAGPDGEPRPHVRAWGGWHREMGFSEADYPARGSKGVGR